MCVPFLAVTPKSESGVIVKSNVTIESHPPAAAPTKVCVAELLFVVYVFPSIQV